MKSVILFYRYPASSPPEKCLSRPDSSGECRGIDLLKSFLGNSSLPDRRVGAIRGILGCTLLILCLSGFTGLIVNAQNLTDEHKAVEQYIEQQQQFQDSIVNLRRQQVINEILEEIKAQKSVQLSIPSRTTTVADAGELAQDRDALIDLYNSTNGDNWTNSTGWKDADGNFNPVVSNDWYGITVDGEGYVVAIRLGINNLNGQIPGSLSNLTRLQALYLYQNQLVGPIPHELGSLSNLVALDLIYNDFNDSIPPEFGNLSNLRDLFLSHCRLIGSIPTELRRLSELLFLGLNSNQITGSIPPELGELLKLKNLNVIEVH